MKNPDYDILSSEDFDLLQSLIDSVFYASGNINDTDSDIFKLNAELYKSFFNLIAAKILIIKLKINESEARKIHKSIWKKIDIHNYPFQDKCFISDYTKLLIDFANIEISVSEQKKKNNGERLSELFSNKLSQDIDSNKMKQYTEQCHFVWTYLSKMNSQSKNIFMYKLYGELNFDEISKIMNIKKEIIVKIYNETEDKLFADKKFSKYFKL